MKKSVRDYMREIESIYKTTAEAVAKDHTKLTELQEKKRAIFASKELNPEGKQKAAAAIDDQISAIKAEVYAKRSEANSKAQAIRKRADDAFFGYYHANPADVDLQMVKLIESGVVSDSELMRMSETANVTMRRMIGRALEHSKDGRFAKEGRLMQVEGGSPHLKAIDGVIGVGNYACGGAPLSGTSGASAFLARWDELMSPVFDTAPNVSWEMDSLKPGEITFSSGESESGE